MELVLCRMKGVSTGVDVTGWDGGARRSGEMAKWR
jgi:hypothetical protein